MKSHNLKRLILANSRGSVLVLVGLLLFVFIGIAALAIDIGYLSTSKNELQNAADAAALGATRQLGKIYQDILPTAQVNYVVTMNTWDDAFTKDKDTIIDNAINVALQNKTTRESVAIAADDIQIGVWNPNSPGPDGTPFTQNDTNPNAVRVTARRDNNNTGQIATFFSGVLGPDSFPVSARATASLSGQSTADEGELELPIGIDEDWFNGKDLSTICGSIIKFSPTNDSCAGWTSFNAGSNDSNLRKILLPESHDEHIVSPANGVGDSFNFVGGDLSAPTFGYLMTEYWKKGVDVDMIYNPDIPNEMPIPLTSSNPAPRQNTPIPLCENATNDGIVACDDPLTLTPLTYPCTTYQGNDLYGCDEEPAENFKRNAHEWETSVLVYESSGCDNPNQSRKIVGYVDVTVFNVGWPSFKAVEARIECNRISDEDTRGGGAYFGVFGSIPGLVE